MLTQKRLMEVLNYSPDDGCFYWRVPRGRQSAGAVAGCNAGNGYRKTRIDGREYYLHRLAYLYMTGNWPPHDVDHLNGDRADNSWGNLRAATRQQNHCNKRTLTHRQERTMETREYRTIDKSDWLPGPWHDEPDKMQWQDEATGLPCLIVRGPSGALCGYVGVAEWHPYFGKEYSECAPLTPLEDYEDDDWIEVHGGLTFSDFCADSEDESRHICHVPGPGEPDHVWWLGFDCAHSGDLSPKHARESGVFAPGPHEFYRDFDYVKAEVAKLARQLVPPSEGSD